MKLDKAFSILQRREKRGWNRPMVNKINLTIVKSKSMSHRQRVTAKEERIYHTKDDQKLVECHRSYFGPQKYGHRHGICTEADEGHQSHHYATHPPFPVKEFLKF